MKKILFIYDHNKPERLEKDGLWQALNLLENDFEIERYNINTIAELIPGIGSFLLGWGGFDSKVDKFLTRCPNKKGLCLSAYFPTNETAKNYDIIFCETENTRMWLDTKGIKQTKHAFGINTDIFKVLDLVQETSMVTTQAFDYPKIWDTISVGSFSKWHRQDLLYDRAPGIVVGSIDPESMQEAFNYVANLLLKGWTVSPWVPQEKLSQLYNLSKKFIATADFGQERAVLEARACGLKVEVPDDNPKLKELLTSPIWDVQYYYEQLKKGITDVIGE